MKLKTCAVAILLLLATGWPARAAEADYQAFAGVIDAQVEVRHARIPLTDASGFCATAPDGSWQPLLRLGTPASGHCAGVLAQASPGRLSLLIATPQSRRATLVELRLNLRPLLDWLRSTGLIVVPAAGRAADVD